MILLSWLLMKWKTVSYSWSTALSLCPLLSHLRTLPFLMSTHLLPLPWLLTPEPFFISKHLSVWSEDGELIDFNILIVTVRGKGEEGWDRWRWSTVKDLPPTLICQEPGAIWESAGFERLPSFPPVLGSLLDAAADCEAHKHPVGVWFILPPSSTRERLKCRGEFFYLMYWMMERKLPI